MEDFNESNSEGTDHVFDSLHVVVKLDQNVIAVCSETGEIKKHVNSNNNLNGHFLRKYGASKRKRKRRYDDSSIWLFDAQEDDLEDDKSEQIRVEECKNIGEHEVEDRYEGDEKISFDHGTAKEAQTRILCTECGESFRFADMYKHHKCIDTTSNQTCEICNFKYTTTKEYNTHLQKHLKSRTSVQCPLCKKIFKKRAYLMTHLRSHSRHRLYQCLHCDREFIHYNQFRTHECHTHATRLMQTQSEERNCNKKRLDNQTKGKAIHQKGEDFCNEKSDVQDNGNIIPKKGRDFDGKRLGSPNGSQRYCEQSKELRVCGNPKKQRKLGIQDLNHQELEEQK